MKQSHYCETEQVLIYSRNSHLSIEPKGVLQCSKEPANSSYSQRVTKTVEIEREKKRERNPIHTLPSNSFQMYFNII